MIRLPKPAGLLPSIALFMCALATTRSIAGPIPFVHEAAPTTMRALPPFARAAQVLSPLPDGTVDGTAPAPAPNAADGSWQEFNLLQIFVCHGFYDAPHDQLLAIGTAPRLGDWALPLGGQRAWKPLPAPSEALLYQRS